MLRCIVPLGIALLWLAGFHTSPPGRTLTKSEAHAVTGSALINDRCCTPDPRCDIELIICQDPEWENDPWACFTTIQVTVHNQEDNKDLCAQPDEGDHCLQSDQEHMCAVARLCFFDPIEWKCFATQGYAQVINVPNSCTGPCDD